MVSIIEVEELPMALMEEPCRGPLISGKYYTHTFAGREHSLGFTAKLVDRNRLIFAGLYFK
jgi:hypothetical protein